MYRSNKRFVVDANFIKNASFYKLNFNEFVLLMYFDNGIESVVNIKNICKFTNLKETDAMLALSSLIEKNLIEINAQKNEKGKISEIISIDGFYKNIKEGLKTEAKKENDITVFSKFEETFGRTLSPNEYSVIKVWLDKLYAEDLILAALKEAEYNGVSNIRYIDKILFEWNKKGYKIESDINKKSNEKKEKSVAVNSSLLEYNWLENE